MSKAPKPVFVCQECGSQAAKWLGRCPDCDAWNSFVEERPTEPAAAGGGGLAAGGHRYSMPGGSGGAKKYADIENSDTARLTTGIDEFDRVLGGGIVPGSLVLLGGEPGIGKSTLLLQAAANFARVHGPVLYASGEESEHQVKSRGERLGVGDAPLYLLAETCVERILEEIGRVRPRLLVVDSIQTVFSLKFQSAPGSIGQVREAATQFLFTAKGHDLPTFLVGHVTKDGALAGPKVLEHVVDTVLYFEGERHHSHRVVRAIKNRFGAISELGVFEMTGGGLRPVPNPSQMFLAERPTATPGSAVLCCVEGSRPLLVEVQALVSTATYGTARRMAVGIDSGRVSLLLAVLEKRAGLVLVGEDVYVNIAGGMSLDEPAADLAVVAALASSVRNRPIVQGTAVFGEVGLGGEVRGVPQAPLRLREARQLGFTRVVLPTSNLDDDSRQQADDAGTTLIGVRHVGEALDVLIGVTRVSFHLFRTVFWLIPAITVYTIVLGTLSLGSTLVGGHGHFAHRCAQWWSWLILATTGVRVRVEGLEHLAPGATYVFVANHQSIYDIPVLFGSLPFQLRIIAKESLGRFPFLGWHLRRTGHMLVDRRRPDRAGIFAWATSLPSRGLSLIVFPEGTRSRDGLVAPFKAGSLVAAVQTGIPIVPISVVGSRHVMTKGELTTRPGDVRLVVHPPLATTATREPHPDAMRELAARVREIVRVEVEAEAAAG